MLECYSLYGLHGLCWKLFTRTPLFALRLSTSALVGDLNPYPQVFSNEFTIPGSVQVSCKDPVVLLWTLYIFRQWLCYIYLLFRTLFYYTVHRTNHRHGPVLYCVIKVNHKYHLHFFEPHLNYWSYQTLSWNGQNQKENRWEDLTGLPKG